MAVPFAGTPGASTASETVDRQIDIVHKHEEEPKVYYKNIEQKMG